MTSSNGWRHTWSANRRWAVFRSVRDLSGIFFLSIWWRTKCCFRMQLIISYALLTRLVTSCWKVIYLRFFLHYNFSNAFAHFLLENRFMKKIHLHLYWTDWASFMGITLTFWFLYCCRLPIWCFDNIAFILLRLLSYDRKSRFVVWLLPNMTVRLRAFHKLQLRSEKTAFTFPAK